MIHAAARSRKIARNWRQVLGIWDRIFGNKPPHQSNATSLVNSERPVAATTLTPWPTRGRPAFRRTRLNVACSAAVVQRTGSQTTESSVTIVFSGKVERFRRGGTVGFSEASTQAAAVFLMPYMELQQLAASDETERGSAGTQPEQEIVTSTACRLRVRRLFQDRRRGLSSGRWSACL